MKSRLALGGVVDKIHDDDDEKTGGAWLSIKDENSHIQKIDWQASLAKIFLEVNSWMAK